MGKFDKYFLMGIDDILEYTLEKLPDIGWDKGSMQAKEIGDGNLNYVFRVWDDKGHSVIIKHAGVSLRPPTATASSRRFSSSTTSTPPAWCPRSTSTTPS